MSEEQSAPKYSALGQLHSRLHEMGERNIRTLSIADMKSVVMWLEARQFDIQVEVSAEDDPVMNAKLRGQAALIDDLCESMLQLIGEVASDTKEEE